MGHIYNVVYARPPGLLPNNPYVAAFGRWHLDLFDLGNGWQRLATKPPIGSEPEFPGASAVQTLAHTTGQPILAVQVSSPSSCCDVWAATPEFRMWRAHLPLSALDCGWGHVSRPQRPELNGLIDAMVFWAETAGLQPDQTMLSRLVTEADQCVSWEIPAKLADALGLPEDNAVAIEPVLDPDSEPYKDVFKAIDNWTWGGQWNYANPVERWQDFNPFAAERMRLAQDIRDSMYEGGLYTAEQLGKRISGLRERGGLT